MSLPRIVLDNSAALPAFFPEMGRERFDGGLVTNRARSLIQAIRVGRVKAFVPPSFFREFLNVATRPLFEPGAKDLQLAMEIRQQWDDLLLLPLIVIPVDEIQHNSGNLVFDEGCPATDSWYVAAAMQTKATFWMSHEHSDGLAAIASRFVNVGLLSEKAPAY